MKECVLGRDLFGRSGVGGLGQFLEDGGGRCGGRRLLIHEPGNGFVGVGGSFGLIGAEGGRRGACVEGDDADGAFEGDGDGPFEFHEIGGAGVGDQMRMKVDPAAMASPSLRGQRSPARRLWTSRQVSNWAAASRWASNWETKAASWRE